MHRSVSHLAHAARSASVCHVATRGTVTASATATAAAAAALSVGPFVSHPAAFASLRRSGAARCPSAQALRWDHRRSFASTAARIPAATDAWPVPAHGPTGKLVNGLLSGVALAAAKSDAGSLPELVLSRRQECDLELLLNGGFSPLQDFMDRATYESVVRTARLPDGTLWPMPITLDISDKLAATLSSSPSPRLVLKDGEGNPLAIINVTEIYKPDKELEGKEVFGGDPEHPSIVALHAAGPNYVAGKLLGLQLPVHYDHEDLRRTPAQVRAEFVKRGWKNVVAFQTRNPLHRAHFELTVRAAKENDACLLLHPVVGQTKPGDIEHHVRVKCYRAIMDKYEPGTALLSALPLAMRMAGPREALWHSIIRQNYGATHFILGRDHAGPGANSKGVDFYGPFAARDYALKFQKELGIKLCPFDMMVYLPDAGKYAGESEVPKGTKTEKLSGTEVRKRLNQGTEIPAWFSFPEVVTILRQEHPPTLKRGFCVFFTGLSGSGKSTIANALLERLMAIDARTVRLLDGDHVRQMLSSELGFSEEHRNLNIQRIGYVSSLMVGCGGAVIAAPIAPYAASRALARKACSAYGGFVEVFVDTPIAVCERRDRKGLYKRAREGTLKHFTGIDDPYEAPLNPDVRITDNDSVKQAVDRIVAKLQQQGYIAVEQPKQ